MKKTSSALTGEYLAALRKHLRQRPGASLEPARELGQQAVAIGLETLDVAKIHERALATLDSSGSTVGRIKRANIFFIEAISPIEETHRVALHAKVRLKRLNRLLSRTTRGLAASNRALRRGIARRKNAEVARRKDDDHYKALLAESGRLQQRLRHLTHQFLAAQEDNRKKMSHDLQDDIAQTLLGINVRLLTLKRATAGNASGLKKEIANTERLVDESLTSIKRSARELGKRHET